MTRKKHDHYSKQFVAELLEREGDAQINYEVSPGEAHYVDLYFVPKPNAEFQTLGLLGKIAAHPCLIEPFRNQPSQIEIQTCLQKLFTLRTELLNKAERNNKLVPKEAELPRLWILATSASDNLLDFSGAKLDLANWCEGVYFGVPATRMAIVAINRLPETPDTLLLRLLGKGKTQQQAIAEIRALSEDHPLRNHVEYLLYRWRIAIEIQDELTQDDEDLIMNLSEIVEQRQQKFLHQGLLQGLQQGKQQGLQEGKLQGKLQGLQQGRQEMVENLLELRFGVIDEALSMVIERLITLSPKDTSELILHCSREELIAKLSH